MPSSSSSTSSSKRWYLPLNRSSISHDEQQNEDDLSEESVLIPNRDRRRRSRTSHGSRSSALSRISVSGSRTSRYQQEHYRQATAEEQDAHVGVSKVEATLRVFGTYSRWCLYLSLALASYMYSLDGTTTPNYLAFATSSLGKHRYISSIQVAQSIVIAVGKPVIAKVADVNSRGIAYLVVLIFYVVGYTIVACAQNVGTIAAGIVTYAVGYTGLQLLTQIIIADITTLKWRGLVMSFVSAPFIVNAVVGSNIASAMLEKGNWRLGYVMFIVLAPVTLFPLISTLLWAERKAQALGLVWDDEEDGGVLDDTNDAVTNNTSYTNHHIPDDRNVKKNKQDENWKSRFARACEQLDAIGLALLGVSVGLILLPLTLVRKSGGKFASPSTAIMLILGFLISFVFMRWELKYASRPVFPMRFLMNRSVVGASLIGFFDFGSFFLTFTYLYSYVLVVKPWTLVNATYFVQIQTVALTVAGIIAGLSMRYLHRYKYVLLVGLNIRLLGVALMIYSRRAEGSDAALVWTQILQGFGGGFAAVACQVGAQASVPHADVGIVTALVLLFTEIGGGTGGAVAGAMWSNWMPESLERHLPFLTPEERDVLFGSIEKAAEKPRGDPIREGVISAYGDVMESMVIWATVLSVLPILFAMMMPNWYLGDRQNAVEDVNPAGDVVFGEEDGEVVVADDQLEGEGEGERRV